METRILPADRLDDLVAALRRRGRVVAPVVREGISCAAHFLRLDVDRD